MIRGFHDKETERVFRRESVKKFAPAIQRAALRKLLILDAAESLADLRVPPGNRLEKLSAVLALAVRTRQLPIIRRG